MQNKWRKWVVLGVSFMLPILGGAAENAIPQRAFPQHSNYAPQTIQPNHVSQEQMDEHVRAYYDQWKAYYLIDEADLGDNQPLYRISYSKANAEKTVSEGQGYGMMIVALMAGYDPYAHKVFDGLYHYVKQHPSTVDHRLMSWRTVKQAAPDVSAFDGDADIAYALLLAEQQWGNDGAINYHDAAQEVIAAILESTIGVESHLPLLGDANRRDKPHQQYTPRSSDFMLAHFKAFGRFSHNPRWDQVVAESQAVIESVQNEYSPNTGLLPDFIAYNQPAPPYFLESKHDGEFYYNAGRVPLRLGMDVLLNDDATSRKQIQRMTNWLQAETQGDPNKIYPGYRLDGTPFDDYYFSTFFVAPFGVAAMTDPTQQTWLNALYDSVYNTHQDYYQDSVTLLSLLVMSGNYWDPTIVE